MSIQNHTTSIIASDYRQVINRAIQSGRTAAVRDRNASGESITTTTRKNGAGVVDADMPDRLKMPAEGSQTRRRGRTPALGARDAAPWPAGGGAGRSYRADQRVSGRQARGSNSQSPTCRVHYHVRTGGFGRN